MLGKSRQAYYEQKRRRDRDTHRIDFELILHHIRERRIDLPKEGVRKLYHELKPILIKEGIKMGRDKLFKILRLQGMLQKRKRDFAITTFSNHHLLTYPNLVKDTPEITSIEQVWASDMTYLRCGNTFLYLSLVTDHYSHEIVGYKLSNNLKTEGPMEALQNALCKRRESQKELIHHSDRGTQYCSENYTETLKERGIRISMTRGGEPTANAIAERVNGILKHELGLDVSFPDFETAQNCVDRAISIYNNKRLHSSIDYMTPVMARNNTGPLKKRWKPTIQQQQSV